jgi:hypothetical protein
MENHKPVNKDLGQIKNISALQVLPQNLIDTDAFRYTAVSLWLPSVGNRGYAFLRQRPADAIIKTISLTINARLWKAGREILENRNLTPFYQQVLNQILVFKLPTNLSQNIQVIYPTLLDSFNSHPGGKELGLITSDKDSHYLHLTKPALRENAETYYQDLTFPLHPSRSLPFYRGLFVDICDNGYSWRLWSRPGEKEFFWDQRLESPLQDLSTLPYSRVYPPAFFPKANQDLIEYSRRTAIEIIQKRLTELPYPEKVRDILGC